jgi:hypothetical protein
MTKPRLAALLLALSLQVHATSVTLPGDRELVEGNQAIFPSPFFGTNTTQIQVAGSELAALGLNPGMTVTGLRLRLNGGATGSPAFSFSDIEILLGEAVNAISGMSTTFADNVTNGSLVYDGAYAESAGAYSFGGSPNTFGPLIQFSSGYAYNGGDLIIQIRRSTATGSGLAFDGSVNHSGIGTTYQSVTGASFGATTGTITGSMPVMQLQAEVPEPGAVILMVSGLALLPLLRRRA